jgi:phage gp29-like protein
MPESELKNTLKPSAGSPVTAEVATARKDVDIFWGWANRMENPDVVLRQESQGLGVRLYEELERDWQVFSMLQTRSLALQACEWQVEPATEKRGDKKIADFVEEVLKEANFDGLCDALMQAVLTGYKPVEVMWEIRDGKVRIESFRGRRPSRFVFDMDSNPRMLTPENQWDGEPVPERKFIVWSYGGHDANPYGRGLGHQCYWPVWFKKNGVKFWMIFAEKFGAPTPVGKYPPGMEDKKQTLLDAIAAIQQETGIAIPEGMAVELLEAKRTGQDNYEGLCEYFDRAIAKILLGQTLTSDTGKTGGGSYALGSVHNEVRTDILKADADAMCELVNRTVVRWLVDYNFPAGGRTGYPKVWRRTSPEEDLKPLAERDKILLVDLGLAARVPESYIEDTYGIPLAKEGERTITAPSAPEQETGKGLARPGDQGAITAPSAPEQETGEVDVFAEDAGILLGQMAVERIAAGAVAAGAEEMDAMLGPILDVIERARSLEEIGEALYDLYPALDGAKFQDLLARAMLASGLTGYASSANR